MGSTDKLEVLVIGKDLSAGKTVNKLSADLRGLGGSLKGLLPALSITGSITAVGVALNKSAADWANYNEEVRKMSIATQTAPEELSRMMQAADDVGVSMDALSTAFTLASKNGIQPTLENIANLSDEMLAIQDPTERSIALNKTFGRNWAEITPFILSGGDAIRESTAAINSNLVVTQKSIAESRRYKVAIDDLSDQWQGLRNQAGAIVLPIITEGLEVASDLLSDLTQRVQKSAEWYDVYTAALDRNVLSQAELKEIMRQAHEGLITEQEAIDQVRKAIDDSIDPLTRMEMATRAAGLQAYELAHGTDAAKTATDGLSESEEDARASVERSTTVYGIAEDAMREYAGSTTLQADALVYLAIASGNSSTETEIFREKIDNATKLLEEKLITLDQWKQYVDDLASGTLDAAGAVSQLNSWLKSLPEEKRIKIYIETYGTTYGVNSGNQHHGGEERAEEYLNPPDKNNKNGGPGGARGLDIMVPGGYPNDTFPVRASSGERVIIIPPGQKGNQPGGQVVKNFNLTIYTNSPVEPLKQDFHMMEAWAA